MTLSTVLLLLMQCTAAPPYDDCGPAVEAARQCPDTALIVQNLDAVLADPALARRVLETTHSFGAL